MSYLSRMLGEQRDKSLFCVSCVSFRTWHLTPNFPGCPAAASCGYGTTVIIRFTFFSTISKSGHLMQYDMRTKHPKPKLRISQEKLGCPGVLCIMAGHLNSRSVEGQFIQSVSSACNFDRLLVVAQAPNQALRYSILLNPISEEGLPCKMLTKPRTLAFLSFSLPFDILPKRISTCIRIVIYRVS